MREILFRGKASCGAWVQGDLIHRKIWQSEFEVIRVDDSGFDNYQEYEVATDTIGQYTGLTDKNGKKIFEGDIMPVWENGEKYHYKVIYNGDCFMLSMLDTEQGNYPLSVKNSISEIIGNIHDNPELLRTPQNDEVKE